MLALLFDLDGTLLLTGNAGIRAMQRAGRQLFGAGFSVENVKVAGRLDPEIYEDAARRSKVTDPMRYHGEFRALYLQILAEEIGADPDRVEALPGIPELLDRVCARDDLTVGLVTGNYREAAALKLEGAGIGIERFFPTAFGDEAVDRRALVALALGRLRGRIEVPFDARRVIVIGDTPSDVDCARANGGRCVGVATGRFTESDLRAAGADLTVGSFADSRSFLEFIDGAVQT
jgi:phosphoglycolate phosphatase-like HAD superfamily hydrolase